MDSDLISYDAINALFRVVAVGASAGVAGAGLSLLMASSDAFAERLATSNRHSAELAALQIRSLATCLADLRPAPQARSAQFTTKTRNRALPPGAPVVT